jgi:hypothetical protein
MVDLQALPQGIGSSPSALVLAINDRLRRIAAALPDPAAPAAVAATSMPALTRVTASGITPVRPSADYVITNAGVTALTLAAPTAGDDDGVTISLLSSTAFAHVLTATGLLGTGTASVNVATFAAHQGAGLQLVAFNGKWLVTYAVAITFS